MSLRKFKPPAVEGLGKVGSFMLTAPCLKLTHGRSSCSAVEFVIKQFQEIMQSVCNSVQWAFCFPVLGSLDLLAFHVKG